MGSTVSILNQTDHTLHIAMKQLTPLHFQNFVKPNEVAVFKTGKVWFTIEAKVANPDNVYKISHIVVPITLLTVGAVTAPLAFIPASALTSIVAPSAVVATTTTANAAQVISRVENVLWGIRLLCGLATSRGTEGVVRNLMKTPSVCIHGVYTGTDKNFVVSGGPTLYTALNDDGTCYIFMDEHETGNEFRISEVSELPSDKMALLF